ncbi:MAG: pilus assembly protein, partial [Rhizobiaceae bacterium]
MRGFFELVRRFRDDERGVFAVLFGVFAIVLIATAGAVVDYSSEELARTKAQQALDSAALGLAPTMYQTGVTEATLLAKAQALVVERLNNSSLTVDISGANVDKANGTLRFSGSVTVPMAFMQLLGIRTLTAKISS